MDRLRARLGVSRDQVRYILTSASLGTSEEAQRRVKVFAADLTGLEDLTRGFTLIIGKLDKKHGERPATDTPAGRELHGRSFGHGPSFLGTAHSTQHRRTTKATQTGVPPSESLGRVVTSLAAMHRRTGGPGDQGGS